MVSKYIRLLKAVFLLFCIAGIIRLSVKINSPTLHSNGVKECNSNATLRLDCNASIVLWNSDDAEMDERRCMNLPCQAWSEWTNCSVECGGGLQQRSRQCSIFDQGVCRSKSVVDSSVCNTEPCPHWSQWSEWSQCTVTCDTGSAGYRTRTRACPKANRCVGGDAFQVHPQPCASNVTCPRWSEWGVWSDCSRTCGRGDRTRNRRCEFLMQNDSCLGSGTQIEPCFDQPCPFKADWSGWSPCTATCGGGYRTRSKLSCVSGPPACPLRSEQEKCNELPCPQWSAWEPWLDCSKTCAGGQRVRRRSCPITHGCVGRTMQLDRLRCNNFDCPTTMPPTATKRWSTSLLK